MRWNILTIVFFTVLARPAFAQKAEIDSTNAKWIESFDKGDFDSVAQLYTSNAIALPPGSPMVRGRVAIGKMWKGMAEHVGNPKLTTLEVKRLGATAIREIGTFRLMTKDASPKEVSGKYLVVWEKVKGEWKLAADIWNDGR